MSKLLTSAVCMTRYGDPHLEKHMTLWHIPERLRIAVLPSKIYCNKDLVPYLMQGLGNVIDRGLVEEIKTYNGCFNIRPKKKGRTPSLHSWGAAFDINATWNKFGATPTMSKELVACFTDTGLDWGGLWKPPYTDGMHFQLPA
jgi:hypothetical protein